MTKRSLLQQGKKRKHELGTLIKVGSQTIGQVYNGVFEKDVSSRKHFLHTPEAIAYTITALHAARRAGAEYCQVLDTDTGIIYKASISKIFDMGKPFNFGYGDQIYLTLSNWLQTVDPEYASHTDTDAQAYSDADSTHAEVKPLKYKSHATIGTKFEKGKTSQLPLWGRRK